MHTLKNSKVLDSTSEIHVYSDLSYESTSRVSQESYSAFGDTACGEASFAQHLMIDFTPIDEVDNDFVQKKCCAFWEFINQRTDLHNLMVLPDQNLYEMSSSSETPTETEQPAGRVTTQSEGPTAVTMLGFVEEKGLIDRTFESRMPKSHCSLGSREYIENEAGSQQTHQRQKKMCKCKGMCKGCNKPPATKETSPVAKMCTKMRDWDRRHPKCRPICKSRRREWRGKQQNTSAELLLEQKPLPECFKRWPKKVFPNGPCPLFARSRRVTVVPRGELHHPRVVRICQAPIDDTVETPYLKFAEVAKTLGAWDSVKACCAFCPCGGCCPCGERGCSYEPHDAERALRRRSDMREFDARVKQHYMEMRIMYDKP